MNKEYRQIRISSHFIDEGFTPYLEWRRKCRVSSESLLTTARKTHEEIQELEDAIKFRLGRLAILGEFADVANFTASLGDDLGICPSILSSNGTIISTFDQLHDLAADKIQQHHLIRPINLLPALYSASESVMELAAGDQTDPDLYLDLLHELLIGSTMGAHLLAANIGDLVYAKHLRNVGIKYTVNDMLHLINVDGKTLPQALAFLAGRYKTFKRAHFDLTGQSLDDFLMKQYGIV